MENRNGAREKPRIWSSLRRLVDAFVGWQVHRPVALVVVLLCSTLVAAKAARGLELETQFDALLPETQPSVKEFRRVSSRLTSKSKIFLVLEGDSSVALRALGDALTARVAEIGPPTVVHAEDGVQEARAFLLPRAALFAGIGELTELRDELRARWDDAVAHELGVDFEEPRAEPSDATDDERVRRLLGTRASLAERFPDGYYQTHDGKALVVAIQTGIAPGDLAGAKQALARVRETVASVAGSTKVSGVRIGYAGDLVTGLSEYGAIRDDLVDVGVVGVLLVLGVILIYFVKVRVLVALGLSILAGSAWTFALTRWSIGHLNVVTGFLFSIIAGNGINCGIIYLARFQEEREGGRDVETSIRVAHRETWIPTATAALAAAAAYGSLAASDFRGLKHFAVIGGAGMILCWLSTYAMVPPLLVLFERRGRVGSASAGLARAKWIGARYDAPFALLLRWSPRWLAISGISLAAVGLFMGLTYFQSDPLEYDMKRLFNQVGDSHEQKRLSILARDVIGIDGESSMAIACDDVGQVPRLVRALEARRSAAPERQKPFEAVHTLFDFVPPDQEQKIPLALEIRKLLVRAHDRGRFDAEKWAEIASYLPPASLSPFGIDDLPVPLARPFTERDGTRGRLVYIEPTHGEDEDDAHYLIRWADSFRETKIAGDDDPGKSPTGETILGSGRVVIFADMLRAVLGDVPRATMLSLLVTVVIVVAATGFTWDALLVLGSLFVGVAWLFVFIVLFRIKLNFLNFVALPVTFGIGVDYAVNIVRRHREGSAGNAVGVLRRTGGAVILCSLTTIAGYLALIRSKNQAVHSLGILAVLGEVCCLLAAVLVLPAVLILFEHRRRKVDTEAELAPEGS